MSSENCSRDQRDRMACACRSVVETLEQRMLLSSGIGLGEDGILSIEGTEGRDVVRVRKTPGSRWQQVRVSLNGEHQDFLKDAIKGVNVELLGGNDRFQVVGLSARFDVPVTADGGAGDDQLQSGDGDDVLLGGPGNDLLQGGNGDDQLDGGEGRDKVIGANGVDEVAGGLGRDRLVRTPGYDDRDLFNRVGRDLVRDRIEHAMVPHFPTLTYTGDPGGYTPQMIRDAYGFTDLEDRGDDLRGRGQAIAVVVAHHAPDAKSDLNTFSREMGLPKLRSGQFKVLFPSGRRPLFDEDWAAEAGVNLQMAHAIAPDADLVLIEAESAGGADIEEAMARGIKYLNKNYGGGVMSLSTGFAAESANQIIFEQIVTSPRARNVTFVAASGLQPLHPPPPDPVLNPIVSNVAGWPSNSPNVIVVGSSTLYLDSAGFRVPGITPTFGGGGGGGGTDVSLDVYEEWTDDINNCAEFPVIPGGEAAYWDGTALQVENNYGQSLVFDTPFFQQERGVPPGGRAVPDLVWHGDLRLGVSYYSSTGFEGNSGWFVSGGSSVGAPSFAGLLAIANQLRADKGKRPLGNTALQKIYRLGDRGPDAYFNDLTFENGGGLGHYLGQAGCPIAPDQNVLQADGAPLADGYDFASGWGSPNAHTLIPALADEPLGRSISRRAVVTGQFLIAPISQGGTGTGTGGSGGSGGSGGGGYFPTPTTGTFTSVYARNSSRLRGVRTLELDSVLFPEGNNLIFTMSSTGGVTTGTGGTTTTITYEMAIMGVDSQTGAAIAPTIDPDLGTFTPGTSIRLVRNGDRVTGLAWVSVRQITTSNNGGGGGGGGGGGPTVTEELRQFPARIRGSISNNGSMNAEFFTVDPLTFERIRTPFNINGIPVFRGRITT